jgi:predicted MPP superfamily phosphohydrolase
MTIVQFSDIHCGMFMSEGDIKDIVATVNSLNADIIVITGDFVDNSDSQIKPMVNALQGLKADVGVFGCLGNHDHFASAQKVTSALEKTPVRLLINANLPLTINNQTIWFIGVDDFGLYKRNFARLDRAIAGVPNEVFKILLSHRPDFWRFGKKADVDLTLAGHTHGGQIGVQIGDVQLNPIRFFHQYVSGLFEEEGKQLYVNVGVGMVGMPVRLVLPELSFFELHTA